MRGRGALRSSGTGAFASFAALLLCLALAAVPVGAAKKKGKKGPGSVNITQTINAQIPDSQPGATGLHGALTSTINVGKQFKGRKIRDVNVTVQTLGTSGLTPGDDLDARLVAPNGANTFLFQGLSGGAGAPLISIGPLTLDDEAALSLGFGTPNNSTQLFTPYAGAATPSGAGLWVMDNGGVRGTWTLNFYDVTNMETSTLVSWTLNVAAGKPFQTK